VDRHIYKNFLNFLSGKGRRKGINPKTHLFKNLKKFSGGMAYEKKFIMKSKDNFIQKFLKIFIVEGKGEGN
jgi:hypothetical protein